MSQTSINTCLMHVLCSQLCMIKEKECLVYKSKFRFVQTDTITQTSTTLDKNAPNNHVNNHSGLAVGGWGLVLMSHMNNSACDTYLWSLSPPQGCEQDRRQELFRHIQTWGTQQLQWVILGETCDNKRLNTDEPIPPMWHHIIPPISVSSPFTGAALKSLHKDTQWTVVSG